MVTKKDFIIVVDGTTVKSDIKLLLGFKNLSKDASDMVAWKVSDAPYKGGSDQDFPVHCESTFGFALASRDGKNIIRTADTLLVDPLQRNVDIALNAKDEIRFGGISERKSLNSDQISAQNLTKKDRSIAAGKYKSDWIVTYKPDLTLWIARDGVTGQTFDTIQNIGEPIHTWNLGVPTDTPDGSRWLLSLSKNGNYTVALDTKPREPASEPVQHPSSDPDPQPVTDPSFKLPGLSDILSFFPAIRPPLPSVIPPTVPGEPIFVQGAVNLQGPLDTQAPITVQGDLDVQGPGSIPVPPTIPTTPELPAVLENPIASEITPGPASAKTPGGDPDVRTAPTVEATSTVQDVPIVSGSQHSTSSQGFRFVPGITPVPPLFQNPTLAQGFPFARGITTIPPIQSSTPLLFLTSSQVPYNIQALDIPVSRESPQSLPPRV
ncbi:hypothetical protein H0H93_003925 [Arthromyces matolae]|nr:hypothetical protein H0H93_003925 [Arthromyces matolae]